MDKTAKVRTWVEIDRKAALHNIGLFRKLIGKNTMLMSVVKSNAYGHGIFAFSKIVEPRVDWFGVDSIVEGLALRKHGIKKPILVLGATLETRFDEARRNRITITVSNFETLKRIGRMRKPPQFHLKIDTGMHRQGFQLDEIPRLIKVLLRQRSIVKGQLSGVYTHFARAKGEKLDPFTHGQLAGLKKAVEALRQAGFADIIVHAAATSGTVAYPDSRLDMVRIGIGGYGIWPSEGLQKRFGKKLHLMPALAWKTRISEVKSLKKGDSVGYDLTHRFHRPARIAIVPVGYWHGFDRGFSNNGVVAVRGKLAPVVGRVSMDMITIDVTNMRAEAGDEVELIGPNVTAASAAAKIGTIGYEIVTRINPLIERVVK